MTCVFCDLLHRDTARWVARTPEACAFAPLDSIAPGHTLVIPVAHHADLFDIPAPALAATMALTQQVAHAMRTRLGASGVNLLHASGPGSEQSVFHLHFHVIPRWPDDGFSTWPTARSGHDLPADPIPLLASAFETSSGPS
ncbi:HIT family protein [Nonomuraea sp. NPDC050310]|uniref:HIT family protein n=1 Tax=Nonomuraea sp. NPDC050310 TaxID=3154935 RepID=UPI0033F834C4